jgi:ADP-ribose pyrophosphatase YjhB (NUDIX family)
MGIIEANIAIVKAKLAIAKEREPRTLYMRRDLHPATAEAVIEHFKAQGLPTTMPADSLHITQIYSKAAVDWYTVPSPWTAPLVIPEGGPRTIEQFGHGDDVCIVQCVRCPPMEERYHELIASGCASKYPELAAHFTLSYNVPEGFDVSSLQPFQGEIVLGPEIWEEIKGSGWTPADAVEKAKGAKGNRQYHREPSGTSKGGQFTSKNGADSWGGSHGGGWGKKAPAHTIEKPGSARHPQDDDKGNPVFVHKPTTPIDHARFKDKNAIATVVPGDAKAPPTIGGIPFTSWKGVDDWTKVPGTNEALENGLPDLDAGHLRPAAGVIIQEKDGRVWLTRPTNSFGGYEHTFPKGGQEKGLTLQQTAVKEAWEETGLQVKITGVFGDFKRTTSVGRYYLAERVGGDPRDMGWESQALRLSPEKDLKNLLNTKADHDIVDAWDEEQSIGKAVPVPFLSAEGLAHLATILAPLDKAKADLNIIGNETLAFASADTLARVGRLYDLVDKARGGKGTQGAAWAKQPRYEAGSSLGGQWKAYDSKGVLLPPKIGSAANPAYGKKAAALYGLASTDGPGIAAAAFQASGIPEKAAAVKAKIASGAKANSNDKWWMQLHQYGSELTSTQAAKTIADTKGGGAAVSKLSDYEKKGAKPGGSNPGALYTDGNGASVLIKGSNNPTKDGSHAHNEVMASKLLAAAGVGVPDMKVVDLQGQHGGGMGVASTMLTGASGYSPADKASLKAAQQDFAVHAWLANYDAVGMGNDNLMMKDGKAFNIDPGGALMFRAQGAPKFADGKLPHTVIEWKSMRGAVPGIPNNAYAHATYGSMTAADLKASAQKLAAVTPDQIKAIVDAHAGPMDKAMLTEALVARRAFILKAAGLDTEAAAPVVSQPAPIQTPKSTQKGPLSTSDPVKTAPITSDGPVPLGKDAFNEGYKSPAQFATYAMVIDQAAKSGDIGLVKKLAQANADLSDTHSSLYGFGSAGHTNYGKLADHAEAHIASMQMAAEAKATVPGQATPAARSTATLPAPPAESALGGKASFINLAADAHAAFKSGDSSKITAAMQNVEDATWKGDAPAKALNAYVGSLVAAKYQKPDGGTAPVGSVKPQFGVEHGTLASSANFYNALASKMEAASKEPQGSIAALQAAAQGKGGKVVWPTKEDGTPKTAAAAKIAAYHSALLAQAQAAQGAGQLADLKAAPTAVKPTTRAAKAAMVAGVASEPVQIAMPQKPMNIATPANPNKGLVAKADAIEKDVAAFKAGIIDQETALASIGVHTFGTNSQNAKVLKYQTDAIASIVSASGVQTATAAHPAVMPTAAPAPKAKAKDKTPKFDPAKVSAPPSFIAWGETGKPGPSGVAMVNEVNHAAAQAIFAAAKTGDPKAVTSLQAPLVDKATGTLTGVTKPVLEHPSQHIKGYATQTLNEIDAQLNPPKVFRFGDGHPLAALDKAFPVASVKEAAAKIGKYVDLGKAGIVNPDAVGLPAPATYANGKLTTQTYASAAQAAIAKMPKTQQAAIKSYTGAGYGAMNKGMWEGNPTGAGKAAGEAIQTLGHEIAPGTILSRKVSPDSAAMKALLGSVGKVLQEPAIQSTAVDPNVWSGNVHLKMVVGPGVKGLYVGPGSMPGGGALSNHSGEKELILPPNTRMLVQKVTTSQYGKGDADGFGKSSTHIIEVLILPNGAGHDGKGKVK